MKSESLVHVADFYSQRADYPLRSLKSGTVIVTGSDKRYKAAGRCMLWMSVFEDHCLISTQHELVHGVQDIVRSVSSPQQFLLTDVRDRLKALCDRALGSADRCYVYSGIKLYCDSQTYRSARDSRVRKVSPRNAAEVIAHLSPVGAPDDVGYLLADDAAFACYIERQPVAFAATHPVGPMSDRVGNVMVGTLERYRRRGCGKAVVSATTGRLLEQRSVTVWGAYDDNIAAIKTALAVGYKVYCRVFEIRFALNDVQRSGSDLALRPR